MIRAVVFDLDNTIYDYDSCHQKALENLQRKACGRYGLDTDQFILAFNRAKCTVKEQLGNTGASHNRMLYMQVFLELIGEKPADGALALYDEYWNTMLETMVPYPYVQSLMGELRSHGIRIAVLTDLTAHIQHRKLKSLGLSDCVDFLVTSEEAGQEKPSATAFLLILKKLFDRDGIRPEEVLMIGDSQEKDVDGAVAAGMKAILFQKGDANDMDKRCLRYIVGVK